MAKETKAMSDWIKTRGSLDSLTAFCERCGESFTLRLPIGVTVLATLAEAFLAEHRKCKEARP